MKEEAEEKAEIKTEVSVCFYLQARGVSLSNPRPKCLSL